MTSAYILAIDQGTTGSTAQLVDHELNVIASENVEFPNIFLQPGWVEHDSGEIWRSVEQCVSRALASAGIDAGQIEAIGITNQRETSLFWDTKSGEPLQNALVWQDRRTADRCDELKKAGHEDSIREKTGLVIDPYFSATKAEWMLRENPGALEKAEQGELLFGTIDSWLTWRLCGAHVTDTSNASRTMLFNIHSGEWDPELLDLFSIPAACLPRVEDSSKVYGHTSGIGFLPDGIPVAGLIGDQQGALFGQACFDPGMAKCTYGTGGFVLLNTGGKPVSSQHGMLTTVAWRLGGRLSYAIEGSAFVAGAAVQWLRDGLQIIDSASEIETLAGSVPSSEGVVFVPALVGLGAPHWRPDARGMISGITRGSTRAHIARATLDGIALQITEIVESMGRDFGAAVSELRVDGGAARNDFLVQLQADLLGLPCVRPVVLETTAMGSALLAGLAVGFWASMEEVASGWRESRRFSPDTSRAELAETRALWKKAVSVA
ncbi:MAG: glycerol kinase GlpK [Gammaproteobacteria bacterium]|jgi:glycerol kinase|nr:glycerol kinase GlpK [Gammaproteobacteria bacterium]MDP6616632.1 glycerol kinase GlpK [Gammaproteobacteria bacterium]MDP6695228.1 glycerol kinase GlpK [Gammaproteobacteria bacterium]